MNLIFLNKNGRNNNFYEPWLVLKEEDLLYQFCFLFAL